MAENRLIHEKSPYLLQHAHNPVNWYPWGKEAFDTARREEKPVFLSIGYSTCHWCHVMEYESFENEELAALLNQNFIAVKVDREERPDIDAVYISVCQALTGSAGWPLTILMTPDQKPFWAGTYLPRYSQYGRIGLTELLKEVSSLWEQNRGELRRIGEQITSHIAQQENFGGPAQDETLPDRAADLFSRGFDPENGGFGDAPKFPTPHNLLFLMEYARLTKDGRYSRMVWTTLTQMARGGLFDQIGGGFSRYSTDRAWLIPHFEKMLYDNALLICAYLEGYASSGRDHYRAVAQRTLDYVLRELMGPQGQFYCGQDADSGGREGSYYLFTPQEIEDTLGTEDGKLFCRWYGIAEQGNFEGKNILNLLHNREYFREPEGLSSLRESVLLYRQSRHRLHRDDKTLTSWNALMITALSRAFRTLGDSRYLSAAQQTGKFLRHHLTADGCPMLCWRDGEATQKGQLDDYAFLAWALLELYQADFDPEHLKWAGDLALRMLQLFPDKINGGFFLTASDAEELIIRPKETYDGAMPSGNSVAGLVLLRLWKLTGRDNWREPAERQLAFLSQASREYPAGHSLAMLALCEASFPSRELICVSASGVPKGLQEHSYRLHCQTLLKTPKTSSLLQELSPFTKAYPLPDSGYACYLCENGACRAPVYSLEELVP